MLLMKKIIALFKKCQMLQNNGITSKMVQSNQNTLELLQTKNFGGNVKMVIVGQQVFIVEQMVMDVLVALGKFLFWVKTTCYHKIPN